jgi:hypothetical protein
LRRQVVSLKRVIDKQRSDIEEQRSCEQKSDQESWVSPKAAELLSVLTDDLADYAFLIFEKGSIRVSDLMDSLGMARSVQLVNQLGWSETGFVDGEVVRSTESGRRLAQVVIELTDSLVNSRNP